MGHMTASAPSSSCSAPPPYTACASRVARHACALLCLRQCLCGARDAHRYVVDDEERPIGVVSLTDVLKVVAHGGRVEGAADAGAAEADRAFDESPVPRARK